MEEIELIKKLLEISNFEELNPVQKEALKKGLLKGKNLVIFAPTASGKTFCCELAAVNTILNKKGKAVYMVPLVALASEKYEEFKEKYGRLGIKVALSVGDLDSSDPWLKNYDWVVCSNEKMDSLIRHGAEWIRDVGLIVCDEAHLLNDPSRGPTLEITLTLLRKLVPNAQTLVLSATIKNAKDLAKWLNANLVISEWRPVKLYQGVSYDAKIRFLEKTGYELNPDFPQEASIVENTLQLRKQVLFFVSTRKSAESLAEKLGKVVSQHLSKNEKEALERLANEVENVLEVPTHQCKKVANCIKTGSSFHHSGLLFEQRKLIEDNFRKGLIRVIVATPSLAYGVNLPSFRVIMRDLKRYQPGIGAVFIPVLEVQQMLGRCGRPQYDHFGEGIILARDEEDAEEIIDHYIHGEPEDIKSKLALEPVLRMHTLALIASEFCKSENALLDFFSKTFYAFQHGDISVVKEKILDVLDCLSKWKFITKRKGKLDATRIGRRVSELYIDPLTANYFVECLAKVVKKKFLPFSLLHAISNTIEMQPLLSIRIGDFSALNEIIGKRENQFLQKIPKEWDLEFDDFLRSVKTALMFEYWINEATEDKILAEFGVTPGELRSRLKIGDWLIYSIQELALLLGYKEILKDIRKLRVRFNYGVKEELIPLVRLKQIGRIRARKLYNAGLTTLNKLRKIPLESLSLIVGAKIAYSIKEQLGQIPKPKEERQKTLERTERF
ncbi:MAG: DEAD/DEAH box helicase [Candidatus Aenigmarchaeota archaeon]|nr:DEAD/DEAH box helicase [Candidatus Aenigmarchaeota archaeon]